MKLLVLVVHYATAQCSLNYVFTYRKFRICCNADACVLIQCIPMLMMQRNSSIIFWTRLYSHIRFSCVLATTYYKAQLPLEVVKNNLMLHINIICSLGTRENFNKAFLVITIHYVLHVLQPQHNTCHNTSTTLMHKLRSTDLPQKVDNTDAHGGDLNTKLSRVKQHSPISAFLNIAKGTRVHLQYMCSAVFC